MLPDERVCPSKLPPNSLQPPPCSLRLQKRQLVVASYDHERITCCVSIGRTIRTDVEHKPLRKARVTQNGNAMFLTSGRATSTVWIYGIQTEAALRCRAARRNQLASHVSAALRSLQAT